MNPGPVHTAFGAWFQRQPDADYVELVARLARGPADGGTSTPRDRANAVYLILHSVHSDTLKHDCAVNPRFRQPLALLVKDNDPMVRNAVVKHSRLFETNLDLPPLIK